MALDDTCLGERVSDLNSFANPDNNAPSQVIHYNSNNHIYHHAGITTNSSVPQQQQQQPAPVPPPQQTLVHKTKYNQAYESKLHQKWNTYYHQLLHYKSIHGHCNYPTMNGSLGRWISRQSTNYRSQKLKSDRYKNSPNLDSHSKMHRH